MSPPSPEKGKTQVPRGEESNNGNERDNNDPPHATETTHEAEDAGPELSVFYPDFVSVEPHHPQVPQSESVESSKTNVEEKTRFGNFNMGTIQAADATPDERVVKDEDSSNEESSSSTHDEDLDGSEDPSKTVQRMMVDSVMTSFMDWLDIKLKVKEEGEERPLSIAQEPRLRHEATRASSTILPGSAPARRTEKSEAVTASPISPSPSSASLPQWRGIMAFHGGGRGRGRGGLATGSRSLDGDAEGFGGEFKNVYRDRGGFGGGFRGGALFSSRRTQNIEESAEMEPDRVPERAGYRRPRFEDDVSLVPLTKAELPKGRVESKRAKLGGLKATRAGLRSNRDTHKESLVQSLLGTSDTSSTPSSSSDLPTESLPRPEDTQSALRTLSLSESPPPKARRQESSASWRGSAMPMLASPPPPPAPKARSSSFSNFFRRRKGTKILEEGDNVSSSSLKTVEDECEDEDDEEAQSGEASTSETATDREGEAMIEHVGYSSGGIDLDYESPRSSPVAGRPRTAATVWESDESMAEGAVEEEFEPPEPQRTTKKQKKRAKRGLDFSNPLVEAPVLRGAVDAEEESSAFESTYGRSSAATESLLQKVRAARPSQDSQRDRRSRHRRSVQEPPGVAAAAPAAPAAAQLPSSAPLGAIWTPSAAAATSRPPSSPVCAGAPVAAAAPPPASAPVGAILAPQGPPPRKRGRASKRLRSNYKRKEDEEEEEGDGDGNRPPRAKLPKVQEDQVSGAKLACPFFKHNPRKYKNQRPCCGPGWDHVHRIKEHIYRKHSLPKFSCPRCSQPFETQADLQAHARLPTPCEVKEPEVLDGITQDQEKKLRSRKKTSGKELTEAEKWTQVYSILFPDVRQREIPSPYYNTEDAQTNLGGYEDYLRRELPTQVRRQLEKEVEQELSFVEEGMKQKVIEIARNLQLTLFKSYQQIESQERDTAGPSPSAGDMSGSEFGISSFMATDTSPSTMTTAGTTPEMPDPLEIFGGDPAIPDFNFDFLSQVPSAESQGPEKACDPAFGMDPYAMSGPPTIQPGMEMFGGQPSGMVSFYEMGYDERQGTVRDMSVLSYAP